MPIDFNQPAFFDPRIDIIGKEVPLAEIEKTGNVLQNRFDKSYEQYSAADEALKQMEARANPVDREKAKELRSIYKEEMDKILEQGDFHNMRRQTENLARNAAINYKVIEEKNAAIQKGLDEIAKSPKYQLDPEGAKQEYLKSLQSINFNPETRTISDFNVGAYNAAKDVNIAQKSLEIAPTIRTVTRGGEEARLVQELVNGSPVWMKITKGGQKEFLSSKEIETELSAYLKTDPEIQAYIARDTRRLGYDPTTKEGTEIYNRLLNERISGSTKAVGDMYAVDKNIQNNDLQVLGDGLNSGGGGSTENPGDLYTPSSINVKDFQGQSQLTDDIKEGLQGDATKFDKITEKAEALKYKYKNDPMQLMKADGMIKTADALKDLTMKYPSVVEGLYLTGKGTTGPFESTFSQLGTTASFYKNQVINNPKSSFSSKDKKEISQLLDIVSKNGNDLIGWSSMIDNTNEDNYENFKTETGKTIPMATFDLNSEKQRNAKNSLATDLNVSDFRILGKNDFKFDTGAKITIQKFATEALGGGEGTVYEAIIKDNDGVEHAINVAPKNKTTGKTLNKQMSKYVYKPLHFNDMLSKGTSFYEDGQSKTIGNILKANKNGELNSLFENVNKNAKITYKDNAYYLEGNNSPFTSVSQLLYSLKDNNKYNNMIQ